MRPFDCVVNGDAAPFEVNGGGRFTLSRQDFVPAYVKPCGALELARSAGLWRFDTRWRHVIPRGAPVWLPRMQRLANTA